MLAGCTISNFYHIRGWQKAWLKKITAPSVTHSMGSGSFFVGAGAARAIARLHLPYLCRPPGAQNSAPQTHRQSYLLHGVRGIIEPGGRQPVARGGAAKQRPVRA